MPGKFADSNIVLYLASADIRKSKISERLLRTDSICVISVQVLNEISNVLRRKHRFSWDETRMFLDIVGNVCEVVNFSIDDHALGLELAERYGFSIFDSMIVASALRAGCDVLYSEDMQHGQSIDGLLTVVNPYL